MDDATAKDLGLRALAAGFRWGVEGALYRTGPGADEAWRCFAEDDGEGLGPWFVSGEGDVYGAEEESAPLAMIFNPWPDFRDPATLGVLLAQARRRHGQPCAETGWDFESWSVRVVVYDDDDDPPTVCGVVHLGTGPTEAAALVAALEAAD